MRPLAITDSVVVARDVDYEALAIGCGHSITRLLVGDHDQTVVRFLTVQFLDRLAEMRSVVALRRVNGIAQSKPTPRRHLDEIVGEGEYGDLVSDLAQKHR